MLLGPLETDEMESHQRVSFESLTEGTLHKHKRMGVLVCNSTADTRAPLYAAHLPPPKKNRSGHRRQEPCLRDTLMAR